MPSTSALEGLPKEVLNAIIGYSAPKWIDGTHWNTQLLNLRRVSKHMQQASELVAEQRRQALTMETQIWQPWGPSPPEMRAAKYSIRTTSS